MTYTSFGSVWYFLYSPTCICQIFDVSSDIGLSLLRRPQGVRHINFIGVHSKLSLLHDLYNTD